MGRPRAVAKAPKCASNWPARGALAAMVFLAYANSFWLGMAQDANMIVVQDARLKAVTSDNIKLILTKNYWWPLGGDGLYRPVTTLSFLFNYAVLGNGADGLGYHITNFLLHVVNVWLLYQLALLIFRRAGPAFFAASIWAVHPICTEAVTGIVGRADLLAAMSVLGGLLIYVRVHNRWAPAALFAVATAGVFAKENAAVLIGLMLLWDLSFGEQPRWRSYAAVAASLVVLLLVRHAVLDNLPPYNPQYVDNPLRLAGFWTARWTAIKVVGIDLMLLVFPLALSCDHSFDAIPLASVADASAWLSLGFVLAVLAIVAFRYRKDRVAFWAVGFFAVALLPTSNLLFLIGSGLAERFLYLPCVAFAVMAAALLYRINDRVAKTALIAMVAVYAVRTIARNPAWNDDLTLASTDLPREPRSFRLHYMLSRALFERDPVAQIDRIIAEGEASCLILAPLPPVRSISFPPTYLGAYYGTKAQFEVPARRSEWLEKALAILLKAREISRALEKEYDGIQRAHGSLTARDVDPQLYIYLAQTYTKLERYPEAVEALRYAQGVNPNVLDVYDRLSAAYTSMGEPSMASTVMQEKALLERGQAPGDPCRAYAELAQSYRDARVSDGLKWARAGVIQHACPLQ